MSVNYGEPNYRPQVEFSWLSDGWSLFKSRSATWMAATLLAVVIDVCIGGGLGYIFGDWKNSGPHPPLGGLKDVALLFLPHSALAFASTVTQNFLTTVLSAGLLRMAIRQIRGETINPGDLFAIGDIIGPVAALSLVLSVIDVVTTYMCCIPNMIADGLLMFALLYVMAEGAKPLDAISLSFNALKGQWPMATLFYFVGSFVAWIGCCAFGIGLLATVPTFIISIAIGFSRFSSAGSADPQINYGMQQPGTWPPPPAMGQTPSQPNGSVAGPAPSGGPEPPRWGGISHENGSARTSGGGTSGDDTRTRAPRQPREPWPGSPPNGGDAGAGQDRPPEG